MLYAAALYHFQNFAIFFPSGYYPQRDQEASGLGAGRHDEEAGGLRGAPPGQDVSGGQALPVWIRDFHSRYSLYLRVDAA